MSIHQLLIAETVTNIDFASVNPTPSENSCYNGIITEMIYLILANGIICKFNNIDATGLQYKTSEDYVA